MKAILFLFLSCFALRPATAQDTAAAKQPFVLGEVRELNSALLLEKRTLNIYLPDGYNAADTIKYPVIYLLDGSADEDFIHIAGLVQFANFSWVNLLPKSIVVGIANVDRKRDFTFPTNIEQDKKDFPTTGGSEKFIGFIETELQPFIEKNYKTTAVKTIIGQSLGGLLATEILFKKTALFTNYIIVSPSLWWNKESLLRLRPAVLQPGFINPVAVYIAVGKEGNVMEGDAKKLTALLQKSGRKNLAVHFKLFGAENHASILHNAVYQAFEKMNPPPPKPQ
jgi:uncharacterized protein